MDFIEAQQQILTEIKGWQEEGLQLVASSSFQTQSLPLLHILSKLEDSIPILFIDTGYHFPETYSYLQQLQEILQLNIKEVSSEISKSRQRDQGNMLYVTQPDFCCHINKVVPLQQELAP